LQRSGGNGGNFGLTACISEIDAAGLDSIEDRPDGVGQPERSVHLRVQRARN
jgi:hypothetical protein